MELKTKIQSTQVVKENTLVNSLKFRNRKVRGKKDPELNKKIIEFCNLPEYLSRRRILEHVYHIDTYLHEKGVRIQGYVYPEDLYTESLMPISIPISEVFYMDDRVILFFTTNYSIEDKQID